MARGAEYRRAAAATLSLRFRRWYGALAAVAAHSPAHLTGVGQRWAYNSSTSAEPPPRLLQLLGQVCVYFRDKGHLRLQVQVTCITEDDGWEAVRD